MIKHLITATSFALGGAGVALAGYLSVNPRAFTHPVAAPPAIAAHHVPEAVPVPLKMGNVIVLDEVEITASARGVSKQKVLPSRLRPCSEWNEVGAKFIDREGATGVREVRTLCAPPNDRR